MIGRPDIEAAYERISPYIRRTPVMHMDADALGLGYPVTFKMEHLQATGSFKLRGAFNNLLTSELSQAGVVATSGGNHGAGVAYAATALGVPSTIYVPAAIAAEVKLRRMRGFGEVVAVPDPVSDAYVVARPTLPAPARWKSTPLTPMPRWPDRVRSPWNCQRRPRSTPCWCRSAAAG